jgi:hypothetical protein
MEKLTIELMANFIARNEMKLKSSHSRLCLPIINRICKKMQIGITFPSIKVDGDLIIDGHHRYLASLLANKTLETIPSFKTLATKETLWKDIIFDSDDWDTEAKIKMLNEEDAKYNNIEIEKIIEILK